MDPQVSVFAAPPAALVQVLTRSHRPYSIPLLRRFRFMTFPGGFTNNTRIMWSSRLSVQDYLAAESEAVIPFAAAYLDFSRGPETELWIYSSMEVRAGVDTDRDVDEEEFACAIALLREVKREQDRYFVPGSAQAKARESTSMLVGNLNEVLKNRLIAGGMVFVMTEVCNKWVFRIDGLPDVAVSQPLIEGRRWVWDVVRREHIPFTISRSSVPRRERTMKLLPSAALYLDDGPPIAWAFLGPDSSLSSLHCEEPYRGRGFAKAVAAKLLRDRIQEYGDDGLGWADVAADNLQSQGVCKSLNGEVKWQISWSLLDLYLSFPDE